MLIALVLIVLVLIIKWVKHSSPAEKNSTGVSAVSAAFFFFFFFLSAAFSISGWCLQSINERIYKSTNAASWWFKSDFKIQICQLANSSSIWLKMSGPTAAAAPAWLAAPSLEMLPRQTDKIDKIGIRTSGQLRSIIDIPIVLDLLLNLLNEKKMLQTINWSINVAQ